MPLERGYQIGIMTCGNMYFKVIERMLLMGQV
jgi:hypothetical protein